MALERIRCPVCGNEAYRSAKGILRHTTVATGGRPAALALGFGSGSRAAGAGYQAAEICSASARGARP